MKFFSSYKSRLILYVILLMSFLFAILFISNKLMQDTLLTEGENHLDRLTQLINTHIESKQDELMHYSVMVRENTSIQEYMFIVSSINSDPDPLKEMYRQRFGWLPAEHNILLDKNNNPVTDYDPVADPDSRILLEAVKNRSNQNIEGSFTMKCSDGIEIVAYAPIRYLEENIGTILLSEDIDHQSIKLLSKLSGGDLFIVDNGKIHTSTIDGVNGSDFNPSNNIYYVSGEKYHLKRIAIPKLINHDVELWLAMTEQELTKNLLPLQKVIFTLVIIGCLMILGVGFVILKDFTAPLHRMMSITASIITGSLPQVKKTRARNEIEVLENQFADMLQALHDKEEEVEQAHRELEKLATTDTLTGLYNRRYLADIFPKLSAQAMRDNKYLNVILFDLDHFKQINDQYGHPCGDKCLTHFSSLLKRQSRSNDYLFRTGGEEFLMICNTDEKNGGHQLAEKIRLATQDIPYTYEGKTIYITVSCGVNVTDISNQPNIGMDAMLNNADKALYNAKNKGRNRVEIFNPDKVIPKGKKKNSSADATM